jgi:hypothetical protein
MANFAGPWFIHHEPGRDPGSDCEVLAVLLQIPGLNIRVQRDGLKRVAAFGKLDECEAAGGRRAAR